MVYVLQQGEPDRSRSLPQRCDHSTPPPAQNSLQHIAVELLLPVAQKLADHLPAEAFALQQEVRHPDWRVRHEATLDEVLDALLRLPGGGTRDSLSPGSPGPSGFLSTSTGSQCAPASLDPPQTPDTLSCPAPSLQHGEPRTAQTLYQEWQDWASHRSVAVGAGARPHMPVQHRASPCCAALCSPPSGSCHPVLHFRQTGTPCPDMLACPPPACPPSHGGQSLTPAEHVL